MEVGRDSRFGRSARGALGWNRLGRGRWSRQVPVRLTLRSPSLQGRSYQIQRLHRSDFHFARPVLPTAGIISMI
jgi:hypothetical protein